MSDGEMAKILPIKPKKAKKLVSQQSFKKRQKELEKKLQEKARLKREELEKAKSKSPAKRVNHYRNVLKDRFNLAKLKKVEMVDAWTQTSLNGTETNTTPTAVEKESTIDIIPSLISRDSASSNFEDSKVEETPISLYKRQDTDSKFRVRVNSTISNNKTFRSPISNSINNDYKKREYNTSLDAKLAGLYHLKNND